MYIYLSICIFHEGPPLPPGALRFVGVDAEWRAIVDYGRSDGDGCSTLQISTADKALIFDMKTLGSAPRGDISSISSSSGSGGGSYYARGGPGRGDGGKGRGGSSISSSPTGGRSGGRGVWDPVSKSLISTSAGDGRVAPGARDLLKQLFEDPQTIKLGWGLSNSDLSKMRTAGKGL